MSETQLARALSAARISIDDALSGIAKDNPELRIEGLERVEGAAAHNIACDSNCSLSEMDAAELADLRSKRLSALREALGPEKLQVETLLPDIGRAGHNIACDSNCSLAEETPR